MANLFLPQLITWFRLDEHVKRLKGRVDALESNPGIQSVSGDLVNNTDPLNPTIIDAPEDGNQYARQDGAWTEVEAGGVSELEKLTEGSGTGWRLLGKNPIYYGDIGTNAVDFSESVQTDVYGATGTNSFAANIHTKASGYGSHAEGDTSVASAYAAHSEGAGTLASADMAHAEGGNTIASGTGSHAAGIWTTARSYGETCIGIYSTDYVPVSITDHQPGDRLFNIGNGPDDANRRDAFTVFKNARTKFGGVAQLKNYTVGTLPVGTEGDTAYVTDATAPTYLGALVGGGAVKCPVFFNGTIWVSH